MDLADSTSNPVETLSSECSSRITSIFADDSLNNSVSKPANTAQYIRSASVSNVVLDRTNPVLKPAEAVKPKHTINSSSNSTLDSTGLVSKRTKTSNYSESSTRNQVTSVVGSFSALDRSAVAQTNSILKPAQSLDVNVTPCASSRSDSDRINPASKTKEKSNDKRTTSNAASSGSPLDRGVNSVFKAEDKLNQNQISSDVSSVSSLGQTNSQSKSGESRNRTASCRKRTASNAGLNLTPDKTVPQKLLDVTMQTESIVSVNSASAPSHAQVESRVAAKHNQTESSGSKAVNDGTKVELGGTGVPKKTLAVSNHLDLSTYFKVEANVCNVTSFESLTSQYLANSAKVQEINDLFKMGNGQKSTGQIRKPLLREDLDRRHGVNEDDYSSNSQVTLG